MTQQQQHPTTTAAAAVGDCVSTLYGAGVVVVHHNNNNNDTYTVLLWRVSPATSLVRTATALLQPSAVRTYHIVL